MRQTMTYQLITPLALGRGGGGEAIQSSPAGREAMRGMMMWSMSKESRRKGALLPQRFLLPMNGESHGGDVHRGVLRQQHHQFQLQRLAQPPQHPPIRGCFRGRFPQYSSFHNPNFLWVCGGKDTKKREKCKRNCDFFSFPSESILERSSKLQIISE